MHAYRLIQAAVLVLPCSLLLSCLGESGSSTTGVDPEGFWGGCMRPDDSTVAGGFYDGDEQRVFWNDTRIVGDPDFGSLIANVNHPDVAQPREPVTRKGCPARSFEYAAEMDGLELGGTYNGIQRTETWEVQVQFSEDGETATGTYRVTFSNHSYFDLTKNIPGTGIVPADGGPLCPDLTGTFELIKGQVISDEQPAPFNQCPDATAHLR